MTRLIPLIAIAAVCALPFAAAACGDDEDEAAASGGEAVPAGVATQYETIEAEVAAEGGETESGPWRIAYIVEPAEPWYVDDRFRDPAKSETHHIEILPIERSTGRLVPEVPITLEVLDADGEVVDAKPLDFYYAEFFHYASNFSVPAPGEYTLRATIEPPTFLRHGEPEEDPALSVGAEVTFEDVLLST